MTIKAPHHTHIKALRVLWQEAFGDEDAFLDMFFSTAFSEDRCLCLWQGETLAAAAYWFTCSCHGAPAAYIYAVATAKACRGRGFCHALMDAIHEKLRSQGFAMTVLVPGSGSLRRFYAAMGYESFGAIGTLHATAGEKAVPIRKADKAEYAALRRRFLPEGAVEQEKENLDFLMCLSDLYAGEDFLLAAAKNGEALSGLELLGDPNAAPGILKALGAKDGTFRTPQGSQPFAMYRPLKETKAPTCFTLAFD